MQKIMKFTNEFEPKINVSKKILAILRYLDEKFPSTEFSIFGKATIDGETVTVHDDWILPAQEVTGAAVYYEEDTGKLRRDGWNVAFHKHPSGITHFSASDAKYLNNQYDISLLYVNKYINDATYRLMIGDKYLVVPVKRSNITVDGNEQPHNYMYKYNYTTRRYENMSTVGEDIDLPELTEEEKAVLDNEALKIREKKIEYKYNKTKENTMLDSDYDWEKWWYMDGYGNIEKYPINNKYDDDDLEWYREWNKKQKRAKKRKKKGKKSRWKRILRHGNS